MRSPHFTASAFGLFGALMLGVLAGHAQQPVLKESPFLPPPGAAKPANAAPADLEFTGVLLAGPKTQVCITRRQAKRSAWIQVGQSADGIEIVSHDPAKDMVVVRADGVTHDLKLKTAAPLATTAPAPAARPVVTLPAPPGTPAVTLIDPPPPVTVAEKEREARMLVSDLLEIGMQQRKAYEEAQRKAAAESARKPNPGKSAPAPR